VEFRQRVRPCATSPPSRAGCMHGHVHLAVATGDGRNSARQDVGVRTARAGDRSPRPCP
jgi:hypothetical protein